MTKLRPSSYLGSVSTILMHKPSLDAGPESYFLAQQRAISPTTVLLITNIAKYIGLRHWLRQKGARDWQRVNFIDNAHLITMTIC